MAVTFNVQTFFLKYHGQGRGDGKNVGEPLEELYIQSTFKGLFLEKEKLKSLEFPMRVYYRLS